MHFLLFEGVCVTAVILAPGACGMGGPSRGSCHHFPGSCGSRGEFPKRRSCCYTRYLRARDLPPKFDLNNPPSLLAHKVWFWTTLHQFWRMTPGGAKSWLFEKKKGPAGTPKPNPGFLRKKRPLRARQNELLALIFKKGNCLNLLKSWFLRFPGSIWVDMGWYSVQMNRIPTI